MSNSNQWDYSEKVGAAKVNEEGGNTPVGRAPSLPGDLRTSQGGDAESPAGRDAGSLSSKPVSHGTLYEKQLPETLRSAQAEQSVEEIGVSTERARNGRDSEKSASTGKPLVSVSETDADTVQIPTSPNIGVTQPIRSVGSRFFR